jgi:Protein of unknown function (DUF1425)
MNKPQGRIMIARWLGALLLMAWAIGCAEGPSRPVAKPGTAEAAGAPVVLLEPQLRKWVAVDAPVQVTRSAGGLLAIQVGLRNRRDHGQLQLQVQTIFMDATGLVLNSQPGAEAPWQNLTIGPNELVYYMQQALQPEAVKFTVRVRFTKAAR